MALLRQTLEFITQHRNVHDQNDWLYLNDDLPNDVNIEVEPLDTSRPEACGTTGCLAGHAVVLSRRWPLRVVHHEDEGYSALEIQTDDNQWHPVDYEIQDCARVVLDLDYDQMHELFDSDNDLADLWALAEVITRGQVTAPEDLPYLVEARENAQEWQATLQGYQRYRR